MPDTRALLRAWVVAMLLAALLFTLMPGIDLGVSGLFAARGRFPLADIAALEWLRLRIWELSEALLAVAAVGFVVAGATGRVALWLPQRAWAFILSLYLLAPGLLVNAGLKTHWGRARPASVVEFGGSAQFTPALLPTDECLRNCSFVSGEASAAAALAISAAVGLFALRARMSPGTFRAGMWMALAVAVLGGLLRLATGRHFLSDVVFAWLLTAGVALALQMLFLGRPATAAPIPRHG